MKVKDLIKELKKMPQNAKVMHLWDGKARTEIEMVYLARSGKVITTDEDMVCYDDEDRPMNAPFSQKDPYYSVNRKSLSLSPQN